VYVLYLTPSGAVQSSKTTKLASGLNGMSALRSDVFFGISVSAGFDLDGDGAAREVLVGATGDDTGGRGRGAVQSLSLRGHLSARVGSHPTATAPVHIMAQLPCNRNDLVPDQWNCSAGLTTSAVSIVPAVVTPDGLVPCTNYSVRLDPAWPSDIASLECDPLWTGMELTCEWPAAAAASNASMAVLAQDPSLLSTSPPLHSWLQTDGPTIVAPPPLVESVLVEAAGWVSMRGRYFGLAPTAWAGGRRCVVASCTGTALRCRASSEAMESLATFIVVADGQASAPFILVPGNDSTLPGAEQTSFDAVIIGGAVAIATVAALSACLVAARRAQRRRAARSALSPRQQVEEEAKLARSRTGDFGSATATANPMQGVQTSVSGRAIEL
jgi:hypothetical protein